MTESLSPEVALSIVENCPLPLLVMDKENRAISCNRAFEKLVGREQASSLMGKTATDLDNHPSRMLMENVHTVCWTDHHSVQHQFEVRAIELPAGAHCQARIFIDISRQIALEQAHDSLSKELEQHILTDTTTGLLNKRGVLLALEPQVARSRRYNSPISVIMTDVRCAQDCEKTRRHVARLLKDQLRWADLIGCTEQQEFILVLPETTPEAAIQLAEKLMKRLQEVGAQESESRPVKACYGITAWRRSDNAEALLKRAATALSQSRAGQEHQPIAL